MLGKLKQWGEHAPFQAEDKYGGYRQIRPQTIAVTSNYSPEELWPEPKELDPIKRRFKIVRFYSQYWPEGSEKYDPDHRANALYPGHQPPAGDPAQQHLSQVEEEDADRDDASEFSIEV